MSWSTNWPTYVYPAGMSGFSPGSRAGAAPTGGDGEGDGGGDDGGPDDGGGGPGNMDAASASRVAVFARNGARSGNMRPKRPDSPLDGGTWSRPRDAPPPCSANGAAS